MLCLLSAFFAGFPVAHVDLFQAAAHGDNDRGDPALEALEGSAKHRVARGTIREAEPLQRLTAHAVGSEPGFEFFHAGRELDLAGHAAAPVGFGFQHDLGQGETRHLTGKAHAVDKTGAVGQNFRNHQGGLL